MSDLRQIIHEQLNQMDIQSYIKDVIAETGSNKEMAQNDIDNEQLLDELRERGVIDEIIQQMSFTSVQDQPEMKPFPPASHYYNNQEMAKREASKPPKIEPGHCYLSMEVAGGRAFLEHLEPQDGPAAMFQLHVKFQGQRFKSSSVPCSSDPKIQESFLFKLQKDYSETDVNCLLSMCEPIHLALIKTDAVGDTTLVSSHNLEWRSLLSAEGGQRNMTIELMGVGAENKVPVGVLELKMALVPRIGGRLPDDVISAQVSLERSKTADRERLFLVYAKQWWKEYLQIRPVHNQRLVKIFAQDENGTNKPVCTYIQPMKAGRLLDTPRQAARFVSLIGFAREPTVGGGQTEIWTSTHAFLCRSKGDCQDHALLLCSLLLGFGLNAYVCVGTKAKGAAHCWVATISPEGQVTFWESLTGHRYKHQAINPNDPLDVPRPKLQYPYRTVGCVFNHKSFYANCQGTDAVELCLFDLKNESLWKAMSEDALQSICQAFEKTTTVNLSPLCGPSLDAGTIGNNIEKDLRQMIVQHRLDQGLNTTWDDNLSYLLTSALAAYENERVTGVSASNEEFQQAIRLSVSEGHTFKGYPCQYVHTNVRKIFAASLKANMCDEIINCRGDSIRLAVRVRVFTYPESACATWVMFACKYKSVL